MGNFGERLWGSSVSAVIVAVEARRSLDGSPVPALADESLAVFDRPAPDLGRYDTLLGVG